MPYFVIRLRRRAQGLATYLYSKPMANYYVSERRDTIRLFWLLLRAGAGLSAKEGHSPSKGNTVAQTPDLNQKFLSICISWTGEGIDNAPLNKT